MTATVRDSGPFEKSISFSVTHAELEAAKTKTARRLSKDLKIKGFRPGKAPRPLVESTVGAERLRSEAIDDLLPEKLEAVLAENEINPALTPELSNLDETADGLDVEVTVTLWPTLDVVPNYQDRTVVVDLLELTDDEIDSQIERVRDQFAQLETVERASVIGDYVSIDIAATHDGADVPEAAASQLLYEVGSSGFLPGIDDALEGAGAGDERVFSSTLPEGFGERAGQLVELTVAVSEVRAKVLPEVTDEWVSDITEFETVAELRQDLAGRIDEMKRRRAADRFREQALEQLVDEVSVEIPEALARAEMDEVLHRFVHRLEGQGVSLDDYFRVAGIDQDVFLEDLKSQAIRGLKTRLVLETVGTAAGASVSPEEVGTLIEILARQSEKPEEFRRRMAQSGRALSLAGDILRNKSLEIIVTNASAVDGDGNPVDLQVDEEDVEVLIDDEDNVQIGQFGEVVTGDVVTGDVIEGDVVTGEIVTGEVVEGEVVSDESGAAEAGAPVGEEEE